MKLKTFYWNQFKKKKWLISGSYNPKLNHIKNHLQEIGKGLEVLEGFIKIRKFYSVGWFQCGNIKPSYEWILRSL